VQETIELIVQVNGKLRDKIAVQAGADDDSMSSSALASEKVQAFVDGKEIKKIIVVKGRLVNIVV
jgi:leucyl-tRNA synthetase